MSSQDTVLVLTGVGLPRWAGRGLNETLTPLDLGELRRDINGTLVDLTDSVLHRRYSVSITGNDLNPLPADQLWKGAQVTVSCINELGIAATFASGVAAASIGRDPVTGSGRAIVGDDETSGVTFAYDSASDLYTATADFSDTSISGAGFIYYRPQLLCMVTRINLDKDEWQAAPGWTLELEEIG